MTSGTDTGAGVCSEESPEDREAFFADPYWVHYAGLMAPTMPGVADCFEEVEYTFYPPDTSRNALFQMRLIRWGDRLWGVVSIPESDKHLFEKCMRRHGLITRVGVAVLTEAGVRTDFPLRSEKLVILSAHPALLSTESDPLPTIN